MATVRCFRVLYAAMENGVLMLASGRTIRLHSLRQWAVYGGLIEGIPTREGNAETIEGLLCEARDRDGHEPFLIEPLQTPIAYEGRYPFGEPAALPAIGCEADFVSSANDALFYTQLTVIWFQNDYAFPLSPEAEAALLALDWDRLAAQCEV